MIFSAEEYVNRLQKEYIDNQLKLQERDLLIQDNNIEKEQIKGYHGREILELLQNADDAFQKTINEGKNPKCDLEVNIDYDEKSHILRIANTGTFFDYNGIKAIVQGNNSSKTGKYIGNKGTGFRSILNWAEEVKILSGDFHVGFSEEFANKLLCKYKEEQQIKKQLDKYPYLHFPMLAVPYNLKNYTEYDSNKTTIEIKVSSDRNQDDYSVINQIKNIDMQILLFIPNIRKIRININGSEILYKKQSETENKVVLQKTTEKHLEKEERFYIFKRVIKKALREDGVEKDIDLAIAIPDKSDNFQFQHLYSYFPLLNTQSPFNCLMHASYALGSNRNTVDLSSNNKEIVKCQIDFLCDTIADLIKEDEFDKAANILVPQHFPQNIFLEKNWTFPTPFTGMEEYYYKKISKIELFQTVNGKNISILDNPKKLDNNFPNVFHGGPFANLLKTITDSSLLIFMEFLAHKNNISLDYEENELCEKINAISHRWSKKDQVSVFTWWNNKYKKTLPNLLKKQNGDWIKYGQECYFLDGNWQSNDIPEWVKIPAIDKEYQEILFEGLKKSPGILSLKENDSSTPISRLICQSTPPIINCINFKYRDRNNVITAISSSVDTYEKAVEYVKWLWKNYSDIPNWIPPKDSIYKFPNETTHIPTDAKLLYLGDEYGNKLAKKLFDNQKYGTFPPPSLFDIQEIEYKNFENFILKFGVNKYPPIVYQNLPLGSKYEQQYKLEIDASQIIEGNVKSIEGLQTILTKVSTEHLFQWLIEDKRLQEHLRLRYECPESFLKYKKNSRVYVCKEDICNYITKLFNQEKWIEINNKRYSPQEILFDANSRSMQKFKKLLPVITDSYIINLAEKTDISYEDLKEVINLFNFKKSILSLSSNDFYGLMLKIPSLPLEESIELSGIVYRLLEQRPIDKEFEASTNKSEYEKYGKVLVTYKNKKQYWPAKKAYLPSSKIVIKHQTPIVDKGLRTNNENFKKILGCLEYNREYKIIPNRIYKSHINLEFQKYFAEFKRYVSPFGLKNDNIDKQGSNVSIILVDRIFILEDNIEKSIDDDYAYVADGRCYYVKVSADNLLQIIREISLIVEDIYAVIANSHGFDAGKLGEIFRATTNEDRNFLICKEFGSLEVLQNNLYSNRIKSDFINTVKKYNPNYPLEELNIDFDNFSDENNTPYIIKVLKALNVDIDDFTKSGFNYRIDVSSYFKNEVGKFIIDKCANYKNYLYKQALNDKTRQKTFLNDYYNFENYTLSENINTVYFDVEQHVQNKFKFDFKHISEQILADREYTNNYDKLNPNNEFSEEISNDYNVQQMIYFNNSEEFKSWCKKQREKKSQTLKQSTNDDYSQYQGKIPQKTEINYSKNLQITPKTNYQTNGTYTYNLSKDIETKKKNKKCGNIGELLIYNLLCSKYGKNNVFPRSEAFVDLKILKPGQAESGDYDLSYVDTDGFRYFVEVKTGKEGMFYISGNEYNFAKENSDKYKLYLVFDIDQKQPKYIELPNKFWENNKYNITCIEQTFICEF